MHQSQSKGKSAEILFELLCMKKGWDCCKPITDFMQYDYVVDFGDGIFKKVQVKTFFYDKKIKHHRCDLRRSKSKSNNKERYKDGDFEIVAMNVDVNNWFLIPWEAVKNNSEVRLKDKRLKNELWNVSFEL